MVMKNSVILKSFSSGISVIMDSTLEFEQLLQDIGQKFKEADGFFKDASFAISLEGRTLTDEEERQVLDAITSNSRIHILCLMGKDEKKNIKFVGIKENLTFQKDENCGQFYRGSIKNGDSIETEHSIVILGDVAKGSSVYSAKDIVILGTLSGEAYAGATGNSHHFVVALQMEPESLKIGDYQYTAPKKSRFGFHEKPVPKIAYTTNGSIVVEPITNELLENFTV